MSTAAFDTYQAFRELERAGVAEKQADAIIKVVSQSQGELATKRDLDVVKHDLDIRLQAIEHKMEKMELRILISMGSVMFALTGLLVSVIKGWV